MPSTIDQFTVKVPNQACFPGSASTASDNPPASPFPLLKVAVAALVNLGNTASYLVSVPFVGFMVLSFYPTLGVNEVGYLSGLLEGSFHVGAFFGALIWAAISERFGRRPAVLLGLAGSSAAAIAFGFAPTFPLAMAARFAWGLLNGNIGVVKTMLSDVCPDDHTTRAFSFIGIAAGVGRIIGPTIGGLLAEPATKYPSLFGGIIVLRMFPYALPCSIGALLSLVTLVIAAVVLEETRGLAIAEQRAVDAKSASHANEREVEDHSPGDGVNDLAEETRLSVDRTSQSNPSTPPRGSSAIPPDALDEHAKTTVDVAKGGFDSSTARVEPVSTIANSMPSPPVCDQVIPAAAVPPPSNEGSDSDEEESRPWLQTKAERESQAREPVVPQSAEIGTQPAPTEGSHQRQRCKACFWFSCCARSCRLLQDPPIFITSAIYTGIGGTAIVSVEVSSLQLMNAAPFGGLSWESTQIGILAAVAGPALVIFQALVYERLVRCAGLVALLRWSLAVQGACFVVTPFAVSAVSAAPAAVQWAIVAPIFIIRTLAQVSAFTCVFVTVANAALPRDRSAVNGLGQAGVSLIRAVMPPLGTALFALSVQTPNAPWPLNWHAVWLLLATASAGLLFLSLRLPPWIESKRVAV